MDQARKELTLEESIKQIMPMLPLPIRKYLASGQYSVVAQNLMKKYSLHIDQGGILERELMLLLMGIEDPEEFAASLKTEAAIPEAMLQQIMTDINQEVFVPLRQEEMKTGLGANAPAQTQAPTPSGQSGSQYFHLENKLPSRPSVVRQPADGGGARPAVQQAPLPPKMNMLRPTPLPSDKKLLADHEEPHIEFKPPVPPMLPGSNVPVPTQPPPPPAPAVQAPAQPPIPTPTSQKPQALAPASYSVDPYREPLE